jgi:hypothetical protein
MSRIGCRTLLYWNRFRWKQIDKYRFTNCTKQIELQFFRNKLQLQCHYKNKWIVIDAPNIEIVIDAPNIEIVIDAPNIEIVIDNCLVFSSIELFNVEELHEICNQVQLANYNDLYKYLKIIIDYIDGKI